MIPTGGITTRELPTWELLGGVSLMGERANATPKLSHVNLAVDMKIEIKPSPRHMIIDINLLS